MRFLSILIPLLLLSNLAVGGEKLRITPDDGDSCYDTRLEACQAYAQAGAWEYDYSGYTMRIGTANVPNSTHCSARFDPGYHNFTLTDDGYESCTPPSCFDKQGDVFPAVAGSYPYHEGADDRDCYFYCYQKINYNNAGTNNGGYECQYTGEDASPSEEEDLDEWGEFYNKKQSDPSYCDVTNSWDEECVDFDHPDNEGGCSANGKTYGTATVNGVGDVTGCFPNGNEEFDNNLDFGGDTDGDGIWDGNDADIDGDGINNGSDPDADGDGIANEDDPSPLGGGGGPDGPPGQGQASGCDSPPSSEGDGQLAAIHQQLWINECQGENTAEGWRDCNSTFSCDGDEIACAALQIEYEKACSLKPSEVIDDMSDQFEAMGLTEGQNPTDEELFQEHDASQLVGSYLETDTASGSCPPDITLDLLGQSITIPMSPACDFGVFVRYFLIISATFAGVMLVYRAFVGS